MYVHIHTPTIFMSNCWSGLNDYGQNVWTYNVFSFTLEQRECVPTEQASEKLELEGTSNQV